MKKLLITLIIFAIAGAANAVEISAQKQDLQAEMLKEKYSPYEITIRNTDKNPVKIASIDAKGIVNNANQYLVSETMQELKQINKYQYLSVVTLGITSLVYSSKSSAILNKQKAALAEAATFETNLERFKDEVIMPNKTKSFKILVQTSENPIIESVFQDTVTNKYISAMSKQ